MSDGEADEPIARRSLFISYARADRPRVAPIAAALTASGHQVWWDAMIDGGAAFAKTIETNLAAADAVVVVWSQASVGSDWVRDEAAHGRDRKRIVPVSLDGTEPPLGFRQYHALDFSKWRGSGGPEIDALIRSIAALGSDEAGKSVVGPQRLRVSRRMAIAGGGVAVGGAALAWFQPWRSAADTSSVAVLPFANLSGDASQSYFSDGLAEEVRAALSRNAQLHVAAPTSSNLFRDQTRDAKAIGQKLSVAYLLEGSVRKMGDKVRIAADLIDTATGFTSWSQTFDRQLSDIFAVQSEIAATVSDALSVQMADARGAPGMTSNVAAFDAYLRGRALFNSDAGEESDRGALAQYDIALSADPKFAAAHAARSRALAAIAVEYNTASDMRASYDEAIAAANRAVALAPNLASAHLALGYALFAGRLDVRGAREPYERAAQLGQGDADILVLYALYCARAGRGEAASQAVAHALALDPLNPRAWRAGGSVAYVARRYPVAIERWKRALELNPKITNAHAMTGSTLFLLGKSREARDAFAAEPSAAFRLTGLAIVDGKLGDSALAQQARNELITTLGDSALYQQAQIAAQSGQKDVALTALERARAVGDSGLLFLKTDPLLDPLRSEPRFSQLSKALGFD